MPWSDPEARNIRRRFLSAIDTRTASGKRPATAAKLRQVYLPGHVIAAGVAFYRKPWKAMSADQVFQVLYAAAWAKAWGRSVEEYFAEGYHNPSDVQVPFDVFG